MQQAARDLNFPLTGSGGGNTGKPDREVAYEWTAASNHVCQGTSRGATGRSKIAPEFVGPCGAARQLGKTNLMAVRAGSEG